MRADAHVHAHIRAHGHKRTCTRTHAHLYTLTRQLHTVHSHTRTHTCAHACLHIYAHIRTHSSGSSSQIQSLGSVPVRLGRGGKEHLAAECLSLLGWMKSLREPAPPSGVCWPWSGSGGGEGAAGCPTAQSHPLPGRPRCAPRPGPRQHRQPLRTKMRSCQLKSE